MRKLFIFLYTDVLSNSLNYFPPTRGYFHCKFGKTSRIGEFPRSETKCPTGYLGRASIKYKANTTSGTQQNNLINLDYLGHFLETKKSQVYLIHPCHQGKS